MSRHLRKHDSSEGGEHIEGLFLDDYVDSCTSSSPVLKPPLKKILKENPPLAEDSNTAIDGPPGAQAGDLLAKQRHRRLVDAMADVAQVRRAPQGPLETRGVIRIDGMMLKCDNLEVQMGIDRLEDKLRLYQARVAELLLERDGE